MMRRMTVNDCDTIQLKKRDTSFARINKHIETHKGMKGRGWKILIWLLLCIIPWPKYGGSNSDIGAAHFNLHGSIKSVNHSVHKSQLKMHVLCVLEMI